MRKLSHEEVKDLIEAQLSCWPLAKRNYDALAATERRNLRLGDLSVGVQWNPARMVSTGAKVDSESVSKRPCFLCRANRPEEQAVFPILEGWEMLVNPFPIFPVHFTIVSEKHVPQSKVPADIVSVAEMLPGMAVFFNGARAGASAPDHLHMQAVLKDEIPLLILAEKFHPLSEPGVKFSSDFGLDLPFFFVSGIVTPDMAGMRTLNVGLSIGGRSESGKMTDSGLVNTFFWTDGNGMMRFVAVPRRSHRPQCYYAGDGLQRIISPGAIDMGGIIITPREEDFRSLSADEIRKIYSEVGFLPAEIDV